jgi:hypothetical protein
MIKGKGMRVGGGRVGGLSVELKQATMSRLVGQVSGLRIVDCSALTPEEKAKFTGGGAWELHGKGSGSNFAVETANGETITVLSRTMLVYFLASNGASLTPEARQTLETKVIGKLVALGVDGVSASKFQGGFEKASVGDKGFDVITALRAKVVAKAREVALAEAQANVGPVEPIKAQPKQNKR